MWHVRHGGASESLYGEPPLGGPATHGCGTRGRRDPGSCHRGNQGIPVIAAIASAVGRYHLQKNEGLLIALSRVVAGFAIVLAFGVLLVMGALLGA